MVICGYGILLTKLIVCVLAPSPAMNTNITYQNETVEPAKEEEKKEERVDNNLNNVLFGSGAGLVAVGGIGAGVVAYNNRKPKNVPTNKSQTSPGESDPEK